MGKGLIWLILLSIVWCNPAKAGNDCGVGLKASWYSYKSLVREGTWKHGKQQMMANGKPFDETALTCACRLYPLGSVLEITNLENGRKVVVKVTDRIGKRFAKTRIDLSKGAFEQVARLDRGVVPIKVRQVR